MEPKFITLTFSERADILTINPVHIVSVHKNFASRGGYVVKTVDGSTFAVNEDEDHIQKLVKLAFEPK